MVHVFRSSTFVLSLGLVTLACVPKPDEETTEAAGSSSGGDAQTTGPGPGPSTSVDVTTTTSVDPTAGADTSAGSGPDDGMETMEPPIFDLGLIPDMPPSMKDGCSKVDFLFVIDNSSSMAPNQINLVANFPAFIDGIQATLDNVDSYQVGVITTDAYQYNVAGCQQLSSLVVQTGGSQSSNMMCGPYDDGYNFMTESDDLDSSFSCAATVGSGGSGNEQPQAALVGAVERIHGGIGDCNEGFIRDDALLIIVYIGNENDNSPTTPMASYEAVVEAKLDLPENVVVMSITDFPGNPCGFGGSVEMTQFTMLWGKNGILVPICEPDYGPFFADAVDIIDVACENYTPPAG
jgi:hypothetical protein